ncbi:MAG: RNA 2',3'-cyclic phosphodiesterase [Planctomycetes bacterium]|nr:RNA 2',3'-cyclic phosphodiesterase [Planctomycetota bacterium]
MPRLFFALRLPLKLCARLGEETDKLDRTGARMVWTKPENLHVTLRFVGEVQERDLLDVVRAGQTALRGLPRIPLVAVGLDAFPDREHPRVLVCGLRGKTEADHAKLLGLHAALDAALEQVGWKPEREIWRPHITLGRVRGQEHTEALGERLGPALRREFGHFNLAEAALLETFQARDGISYTPLQTFSAC